MGAALQRMMASFYTRQLEVVLVGLENSGKTTLMNGKFSSHNNVGGKLMSRSYHSYHMNKPSPSSRVSCRDCCCDLVRRARRERRGTCDQNLCQTHTITIKSDTDRSTQTRIGFPCCEGLVHDLCCYEYCRPFCA